MTRYHTTVPGSAPTTRTPGGKNQQTRQAAASQRHYTPIAQLNMCQNDWTIKVTVVSKSSIRPWSSVRGAGLLFDMKLMDSSGMDIRATLFNEAVEKFYHTLHVGSGYIISKGHLKKANMKFNTCKSTLEMTLNKHSEIKLCTPNVTAGGLGEERTQSFEFAKTTLPVEDFAENEESEREIEEQELEERSMGFVKTSQVGLIAQDNIIEIIGIVQGFGDTQHVTTNSKLQQLDVTIIDETGVHIRVTLWDEHAIMASQQMRVGQVVVFRGCRVSHFGGSSLSGPRRFIVNPDIPETQELLDWWITRGVEGLDVNPVDVSQDQDPLEFTPSLVCSSPKLTPVYKHHTTNNTTTSSSVESGSKSSSRSSVTSSPCSVVSHFEVTECPITPIAKLNRNQSQWTIKARVVSKSNMRSWSTKKGQGILFSMELSDGEGMTIRATLFNEAVEKFYYMLQVGSSYTFSKGYLKEAPAKFNKCKSPLEMTLDKNSEILLCDEEEVGAGIAPRSLNFL